MWLYLNILLLWCSFSTAEYVEVIQEFRDTGDDSFPEYVAVSFNMDAGQVNIRAFRNLHVPIDIPIFIGSSQGTSIWVDTKGKMPEEAYLSLLPKAEFLVRPITDSNTNKRFSFEGIFEFGGEIFTITPDEGDVMDRRTVLPNSLRVANRHMVQRLDATALPNLPFDIIAGTPVFVTPTPTQDSPVAPGRQRREARYHKIFYTTETLVVADYTLFQKFYAQNTQKNDIDRYNEAVRSVKSYVTKIINGVDMRFLAINDTYSVYSVKLSGIVIATTADSAPGKGSTVNGGQPAETLLKTFNNWLEPMDAVLIPFDFAVLFTEDDLTGALGNHVIGAGVSQSMCSDRSSALVRNLDYFSGTQATAHLIAQALGAKRDGVDNICSDGTSYIMSPRPAPRSSTVRASNLKFSSCSVKEINTFLKQNVGSSNCMQIEGRGNPDVAIDFPPMNVLPGQQWTPDDQCRLLYGQDSYYCGGRSRDRDICNRMECFIPNRGVCFAYEDQHAADGTACANKMMCLKKKCVRSSTASFAQDDCLYRDYKGVLITGKRCEAIIRSDCYDDVINDRCCSTCASLRAEVKGCEFGDRAPTCDTIRPSECYNAQIAQRCCDTCARYKTKEAGCEYGDRSNTCMDDVRSPRDCYHNEPECCATCSRYKTNISNCEFGNKEMWCNTITRDRCYMDSKTCCKTCHDARQLEYEGCEYGDHESSCGSVEGRHCYFLEKRCCEKCRRLLTGPPGCEWGDELENCVENDCKHPDTRRKCCKFCGDFNARNPVSLNTVTPQMLGDDGHSLAYTKAPPLEIIEVCNGDQAVWCKDMETSQCYTSQEQCCETCNRRRRIPSKNCPYGDHYEWCQTMDLSQCTSRDKREACCERCNGESVTPTTLPTTTVAPTTPEELVPSCLKDNAGWCPSIRASQCYVSESTCCVTCRRYLRNVKGCHYGDRVSWCADYVTSEVHCRSEEMQQRCCQSCSRFTRPTESAGLIATATKALQDITKAMFTKLTTAMPGTEAPVSTIRQQMRTTESVPTTENPLKPCAGPNKAQWCSNQHTSTCYKNHDLCCDLCSNAYTGNKGCEFGDKVSWCSSHVTSAQDCYRRNDGGRCCGSCAKYYTNNPECPYGDRKKNCDMTQCGTEQGRRECCFTCSNPGRATDSPVTTSRPRLPPVSNCEGDKISWCSTLDSSFCYEKRTREDFCCAKCRKFWRENPGCEYGDHFIWCARISKDRCSELGADCCETCSRIDL